MPADDPDRPAIDDDDEPDPRILWRWVGDAARPWVGWVLIGLGGLLMLLGYFGVSRESLPAKQIPYLVSGGIGGVFLAVVGAYFLGTEELRQDSGRLDRLERMVDELHQALLRRPDAPDRHRARRATADGNGADRAGPAGRRGRRAATCSTAPTCPMVEGKDGSEVTPAAARKRGLRPCPLCAPAPARLAASAS